MQNQDDTVFDVLDFGTSFGREQDLSYNGEDEYQMFIEYRKEQKNDVDELVSTGGSIGEELQMQIEPLQNNSQIIDEGEVKMPPLNHTYTPIIPIEYSMEQEQQRRIKLRLKVQDIPNVGKHLRAATASHLQMYLQCGYFVNEQKQVVSNFIKSNGSLRDFAELFNCQKASEFCREYFESSKFVKYFLFSKRMSMQTKIMMLRQLQEFRRMLYKKKSKWKSPEDTIIIL